MQAGSHGKRLRAIISDTEGNILPEALQDHQLSGHGGCQTDTMLISVFVPLGNLRMAIGLHHTGTRNLHIFRFSGI